MSATVIQFEPKPPEAGPPPAITPSEIPPAMAFNLPPVCIGIDIFYPLFGMTNRQVNMAFSELVLDREALRRFSRALESMREPERLIEAAIEEQRQELLAAMFRRYPAAARRILAGLSKPRPSKTKKAGRAKAD
jgi:hypothetical protein